MSEKILFSPEQCPKCMQTKELITEEDEIKIVTFSHEINDWSEDELKEGKIHNVFEDLQITASILWLNGEKIIGYLRILK